jgi:hypothetical protein
MSKVQEANTIKQYMTIRLLNVDFKIFPKLLNDRLSLIADNEVRLPSGRNILEGVVTLHEVLDELKRSKR